MYDSPFFLQGNLLLERIFAVKCIGNENIFFAIVFKEKTMPSFIPKRLIKSFVSNAANINVHYRGSNKQNNLANTFEKDFNITKCRKVFLRFID